MAAQFRAVQQALAVRSTDVVVTELLFMGAYPLLRLRDRPRVVLLGISPLTVRGGGTAPYGLGLPPAEGFSIAPGTPSWSPRSTAFSSVRRRPCSSSPRSAGSPTVLSSWWPAPGAKRLRTRLRTRDGTRERPDREFPRLRLVPSEGRRPHHQPRLRDGEPRSGAGDPDRHLRSDRGQGRGGGPGRVVRGRCGSAQRPTRFPSDLRRVRARARCTGFPSERPPTAVGDPALRWPRRDRGTRPRMSFANSTRYSHRAV